MSDSSRSSSPHSCSSESSYRPEVLPGFPLSLQDLCLLHVLFQVDEYPVGHLALLPRAIRQRLFNGLTYADILHLSDTTLFSDLYELESTINTARDELLWVILEGDPQRFICSNFDRCYCLDFFEHSAVDSLEFYQIICDTQSFTSLEASFILRGSGNSAVVPKHLCQYAEVGEFLGDSRNLPPEHAQALLNYCNMPFAPRKLKIDCYAFTETAFWKNYKAKVQTLATDPVIPVLQNFLSSVEEVELGRTLEPRDRNVYRDLGGVRMNEALCVVPYVLLYNVVTSDHPCLRHLKVFDIPVIAERILEAVAELICTRESDSSITPTAFPKSKLDLFPIRLGKEKADAVPLIRHVSAKPEPYRLDSISILPHGEYRYQMCASSAQHIASVSQSIIAYQMQTLRSITVENIGFCMSESHNLREIPEKDLNVPAYMGLLSLLCQFLKQPQFEALSIDKTPFRVARELIVTFLTTPTRHKQTLSIEGRETEEEYYSNVYDDVEGSESNEPRNWTESSDIPPLNAVKQSPPSQSFPEANALYKYLDVGKSCTGLLSTFLELRLKKLTIRMQDISCVPDDMTIQVEHISFTPPTEISKRRTPSISTAQLEKFIVSNLVLRRLEFTAPRLSRGVFPALNHCLSVLYQQGRGLEEIILNSVQFSNCEHMKEFFIRVRDLSHDHGTTLVISASDKLLVRFPTKVREHKSGNRTLRLAQWSTQEDESRLFVYLSHQFQDKKIEKIVFTAYDNEEVHLLLEPLTKELIVCDA